MLQPDMLLYLFHTDEGIPALGVLLDHVVAASINNTVGQRVTKAVLTDADQETTDVARSKQSLCLLARYDSAKPRQKVPLVAVSRRHNRMGCTTLDILPSSSWLLFLTPPQNRPADSMSKVEMTRPTYASRLSSASDLRGAGGAT